MIFSDFQKDIFDKTENTKESLIVNAVAGSGKTTTIVEIGNRLKGVKSAFVAYNKHIVEELQNRLPFCPYVGTCHSLGFKSLRQLFPRIKLENNKNKLIIEEIPYFQTKEGKKDSYAIGSLISLVKGCMVDYKDLELLEEFASAYNILIGDDSLPYVKDIIEKGHTMVNTMVDFDDMIYLPVALNLPCEQFEAMMIDEAQDYNSCQIELAIRHLEKGRIIAVGDRRQAIYQFRGANSKAMDRLAEAFKAVEMPLSISYRCPKSHVKLAQTIVPNIESTPDAIDGKIIKIKKSRISEVEAGSLILCRNNAPIVSQALECLKKGRKVSIRGKDLAKNIIKIIKSFETNDVKDLIEKLYLWEIQELIKFIKLPEIQETIRDKVQVILAFAEDSKKVDEMLIKIQGIFEDESQKEITFSTVHRAKGLEADSVYILEPKLLRTDSFENSNVAYVAYTRSKKILGFIY